MSPTRDDANPTQDRDGLWWFYDENDFAHGPYATQIGALRGLLQHVDPEEDLFYKKSWIDSTWVTVALVIVTVLMMLTLRR